MQENYPIENATIQIPRHLTFDVGICAYNEAQNIEELLRACVLSEVRNYRLGEIVVVSSGSDDGTDKIVRGLARQDRRIQLLVEPERTGKSSAINKILALSRSDIILLISADVLPSKDAINRLLEPFHESKVGMVGCRVSPVNGHDSICGNTVRFIWSLHDLAAAGVEPKFGEAVAFRRDLVE
ncbi:MAG: glycosyltransferase, partial [Nitrosopumilaceae archaeon]